MSQISGDTPVMFPMRQLLGIVGGAIVLLVGGLWVVLSFTIGGLRDDLSALRNDIREDVGGIRSDIGKLQESAIAAPTRFSEAEDRLSKEMSDLRIQIEQYHGELKATNVSLEYLVQDRKNKR